VKPLVIGVGARGRGDDEAGIVVARAVAQVRSPDVDVIEQADPVDLVRLFEGRDLVVVVDAVAPADRPGAVSVLDASQFAGQPTGSSSHGFGVGSAIELARTLERLPARLVVVGIEVGSVARGQAMSPDVQRAIPAAVAEVWSALGG